MSGGLINSSKWNVLTGQYESDESKETAAAPGDEAREDNVSDERLHLFRTNRLMLLLLLL